MTVKTVELRKMQSNSKQADRSKIAGEHSETTGSTDMLDQKTPLLDWNEAGPSSVGAHKLTEDQYEELAAAIDAIIEWIQVLGAKTPVNLSAYNKEGVIDDQVEPSDVDAMVKQLSGDTLTVVNQMRAFVEIAEEADDVFATSLLTARIAALEKASWMLSANLSSIN
ncbi:Dps family protein [Parasphingorhabdus sp.]|jgi:starvation-inducible DNA-binding protein|uniref:Dps family protein n=1 Tax=Parasphingorhabdus sp. TaxID=2709688 RepID=UPI0030027EC2